MNSENNGQQSSLNEFKVLQSIPMFERSSNLSFYFSSLDLLIRIFLGRPWMVKLISRLIWRALRKEEQQFATNIMLKETPDQFAKLSQGDVLWLIGSFNNSYFILLTMLIASCPFSIQRRLFEQTVKQLQGEIKQPWIDHFAPRSSS